MSHKSQCGTTAPQSLPTGRLGSGWPPLPLQREVVVDRGGRVGRQSSVSRIQVRVHKSSVLRQNKGNPFTVRRHEEDRFVGGGPQTQCEGGDSSHLPPFHSGVLVDVLSCNEEERRMAADPEPEAPECLHKASEVPNGVAISRPDVPVSGRVGSLHGSQRCLSPYLHPPKSSAMVEIHGGQPGLRVQQPSFRPIHGSSGVHSSCSRSGRISQKDRRSSVHVLGRLAHRGSVFRGHDSFGRAGDGRGIQPGVYSQPREILSHSVSGADLPRGQIGPRRTPSFPNSGKSPESCSSGFVTHGEDFSPGVGVAKAARPYCEYGRSHSLLQAPYESHPVTLSGIIRCDNSLTISSRVSHLSRPGRASLVERSGQLAVGGGVPHSLSSGHPYHGCFSRGMGWVHCGAYRPRDLVSRGDVLSHQPARVVGSQEFPLGPSGAGSREEGSDQIRQFNCSFLHQQTGGDEVSVPLSGDQGHPPLVHCEGYHSHCGTHSWCNECSCGQPLQGCISQPLGVGPFEVGVSEPPNPQGFSFHGSFRKQYQSSTPGVLFEGQGSDGLGIRRPLHPVVGSGGLRVPSSCLTQPSPSQDSAGGLHHSLDCTIVAEETLVPAASSTVGHGSGFSSDGPEPSPSPRVESEVSRSGDVGPDCLDLIKKRFKQAGLSEESADLAARGRRKSTINVYSSRARYFFEWCKDHKIDPSTATVGEVSDFLRSRFELGLQASTVQGYLSAILSFHSGCRDGGSLKDNKVLGFLIEGMEISRPKARRIWPAWDLHTALSRLNEVPFEPLQSSSLRNIAMKTLFLIALASGKRCSELHALSIGSSCVFSRAGVTLYFRPGFLAKNERHNFSASPIFLPYINRSDKRAQRLSCPVRALKWYLDRTKIVRGQVQQLFIINVKPFRAAAKITLAGWLIEVIKLTKALQGEGNPRAHSVRAASASWAHARGLSITEILNTVSWKTESTFTRVYLKDVHLRTAQGRYATQVLGSGSQA